MHRSHRQNRVLVVEDNDLSRHALSRLLSLMGHTVTEAATVAEGLAQLDGHNSLILDMNLPDGDGTCILQKARESKTPIKVAVYTGTEDRELLASVRKVQPDGLFFKPVDLPALLEWMEQTA